MDESTRSRIRHIFLSPRPNFALMTAADLLGFTLKELKREIEDGSIVAVCTAPGERMTREELVAVARQKWEQSVKSISREAAKARSGRRSPLCYPRRRMTNIEVIERKGEKLSPEELAEFRAWFIEHDWETWDRELERDVAAG